jgi:group I intron endonuclease
MNNKISGIYKITCLATNKIYIGSSFDVEARIKKHFTQLEKNKHINQHLQSSYNLYGKSKFIWDIIEKCRIEDLLVLEQFWMDKTKCYDRDIGFNNCIKSDRPLGYKHTNESKKIMSELKKGKKLKPETILKIKKANTGKKRTEEQKQKMSKIKLGNKNPMYGRKEQEDHKKKRMQNCLNKPRWNKGLTKKHDPRIEKLATWKGKLPPNALKCKLINLETNESWIGDSLKELSFNCPISLPTLWRLKNNSCGKKIKNMYLLTIYEN